MTDATTAIIRRHVEAVTKMLIDDQAFQPGLAITAGQMLAPSGVAKIGMLAEQSGMDIIHLDFVMDDDRATLNDILIAAPRDHRCFVYTRCKLSLIAAQAETSIARNSLETDVLGPDFETDTVRNVVIVALTACAGARQSREAVEIDPLVADLAVEEAAAGSAYDLRSYPVVRFGNRALSIRAATPTLRPARLGTLKRTEVPMTWAASDRVKP